MLWYNCKRLNFVHNKRCPNPLYSPQDWCFFLSTVIYSMHVMNHLMISLFPQKVCVYRMSLANFWDVTLEAIQNTDMAAAKTRRYDSVRGPHPWRDSRERPSPMAWLSWEAHTHGVTLVRDPHPWRDSCERPSPMVWLSWEALTRTLGCMHLSLCVFLSRRAMAKSIFP